MMALPYSNNGPVALCTLGMGLLNPPPLSILVNVGLPSFDTVLANAATSFMRLWHACDNRLVAYLRELNY